MAKLHLNRHEGKLYIVYHCPACGHAHMVDEGWGWDGSVDAPTFHHSVMVNRDLSCPSAPRCHAYIRSGKIVYLNDCTHNMPGRIVDIPDWDELYYENGVRK